MIYQLITILGAVNVVYGSYVTHPNINFDPIQQLTLSGSFNGISIYKDTRQLTTIPSSTSSIISLSNDTLQLLATSNINGTIYDACMYNSNQLIIAGNFTSINSDSYNNIAAVDITTNTIKSLQKGLDGPVNALLCDNNQIYIGGSFIAPTTLNIENYSNSLSKFGGSVAIYTNNQFNGLPWKGLNGPVNSIIKNKKNQIIFGGKFDTTTDGQSFHSPTSQPISIPASGVSATSGTNPSSILCASSTSNNAWQLTDGASGTWQASFIEYSVNPSLVRIVNSKVANHQTKGFSIHSLTDISVNYPLAYLDPVTGIAGTCTDNCTLSNDPSVTYQDFRILNQTLTSGIAIDIKSWYGTSGGLSSVQVFQSEIFVYAVDSTTTSPCTTATTSSSLPKVTTSSTWTKSTTTPNYLSHTVKSKTDKTSVTFYPNLVESGIYEVLVYTPACTTSGCTDRTDIDIAIATSTSTTVSNITMSQKYPGSTSVYTGYFDISGTFEPNIVFTLASNATITNTSNIVAYAIQFIKTSSNDQLSSILQYNSTQTTITMDSLSWGALPDNVPYKSVVQTMELSSTGDILFIGGNFTGTDKSNNYYNNIVQFDSTTNQLKSLSNGGLNGPVQSIAITAQEIYVGGSFTATSTATTNNAKISNVARYNTQSAAWSALDGGVNGPVASINVLSNNALLVSGNFTQLVNQQQTVSSSGNAWWNSQNEEWIIDSSVPFISGTVYKAFANNNIDYFIGNVKSASRYQTNGISFLTSADTLTSPFSYNPVSSAAMSINAGVLFNSSSTSAGATNTSTTTAIFGGSFNLPASGNSIQNIAIYYNNNNTWSGIQGADWQNGQINSMAVYNDLLYVGGRFTGTTTNNLAVFSLSNKSLSFYPNVQTNDGSPANVNIIRYIPTQNSMIVGGNFSSVGSLTCSSVCAFNTANLQWNSLGTGLVGEVSDMALVNNKLVASGNFTLNNSPLPIAQYDFTKNTWGPFGTADLPGPSQYLSYDNVTNHLYISGQSSNTSSTYLRIWDGQVFNDPAQDFKPGTVISKLNVLPLVNATAKQNILLATGYINLGSLGNVSAAFYDGQVWIPYLVTSNANGDSTTSLSNLFYLDQPYIVSVIKHYLPTPIVILVAIAVSLGIVFLIVLGAMIILFIKRKRDSKVNPQSNPAAYYGKPPRTPESLLTMLNEASPDDDNKGENNNYHNNFSNNALVEKYGSGLEGTQQFYNMSRSISTDHIQEQNVTHFNGTAAMTTARAAPPPPTTHSRSISNHNNNAFMPSTTTTAANTMDDIGAGAVAGAGAMAAMGAARPESYARPISEYQRDTNSFYNNEYTSNSNNNNIFTPREMAEVPNRNSYNPFRNSGVGVALGDGAAAAITTGAFSSSTDNHNQGMPTNSNNNTGYNSTTNTGYINGNNGFTQQPQKGQAVTYDNIPPANKSTAAITDAVIAGGAAVAAGGAFATASSRNVQQPSSNNYARQQQQGGQSVTYGNIPPQNPSSLSVGTPETVRWTTTAPTEAAAAGYAVVKPISLVGTSDESSLVDPISGPQAKPRSINKSNNKSAAANAYSSAAENVKWTSVPSSKDALATAFVIAAPVIAVHASADDEDSNTNQQQNKKTYQNSTPSNVAAAGSASSLSVNNKNGLSSSNVQWTNFDPSNALGVATIEHARESLYNDHDSFYSPGPLKIGGSPSNQSLLLDAVNTTSEGGGLSSDPDIVRWTTAPPFSSNISKAIVEPVMPSIDNDDRVSGLGRNQYQVSLSSVVGWPNNEVEMSSPSSPHAPETHIDAEIAAAAAAIASQAAYASNNHSDKDVVNTKVMHKNAFRLSDAGTLPPIDTNVYPATGNTNPQEALLSPDSAVRWKNANVGSPIETAYAPNTLEPATATVTRRSANEDTDAFENYYHPKPQQATIVPNPSASTSTSKASSSKNNNKNYNSKSTSSSSTSFVNNNKSYKPVVNDAPRINVIEEEEPVGRKSEAIDDVIAKRDLDALSMIIQDEETDEEVKPTTAVVDDSNYNTTPVPTNTRSTPNPAAAAGAGAADGRAASKRMVEEYISSRKNKQAADEGKDKKSKYKSDFKSVMASAIQNNANSPIATEDHPHLYYAKFDFSAREHGELGFEKADPIIVVDSSDDIWWMGYKADKSDGSYIQGVFPSNYVEIAVAIRD